MDNIQQLLKESINSAIYSKQPLLESATNKGLMLAMYKGNDSVLFVKNKNTIEGVKTEAGVSTKIEVTNLQDMRRHEAILKSEGYTTATTDKEVRGIMFRAGKGILKFVAYAGLGVAVWASILMGVAALAGSVMG